jgi:hypothetical protein
MKFNFLSNSDFSNNIIKNNNKVIKEKEKICQKLIETEVNVLLS